MKFEVRCMFAHGVLLPLDQFVDAPRYTGNFVLEDHNRLQDSHMVRTARVLDLADPDGNADLVLPLFNAEVVSVDDNQLVVRGYSVRLNRQDGKTGLDKQCWSLRLCEAE